MPFTLSDETELLIWYNLYGFAKEYNFWFPYFTQIARLQETGTFDGCVMKLDHW